MHLDDATREKLEAAAFRALMHHLLEKRADVQNIDLMNLAGFCRNCLADWIRDAGAPYDKEGAREVIHGMASSEWKQRFHREATPRQLEAMAESLKKNAP